MPKTGDHVVVTTEFRGVFFGELLEETSDRVVILKDAQNCLRWSEDVRGFLGLAESGPSASCRVGPAPPELKLYKVTSITKCTPKAVEGWKLQPWN